MSYVIAYFSIVVVIQVVWFVFKRHNIGFGAVMIVSYLWPVTLFIAILYWLAKQCGYYWDVKKSDKIFGLRRGKNPNVKGFAICILKSEFQFWRNK